MQLSILDIDEPLSPGEVIQLHFRTIGLGLIQAAQIAAIESKLSGQRSFTLLRHTYDQGDGIIKFDIRIEKTNPAIVTAALIIFLIKVAAVGVLCWLIFEGAYKIVSETKEVVESPAGAIAVGGVGALAIIAAVIIIFSLIPDG